MVVWSGKCSNVILILVIVSRWDWLWSPANIKGANKDAKIYVGRSVTLHNLLFCAHTLCIKYGTNMVLMVSSSVWSKQLLCFVQSQGQNQNKNMQQRTFHNHSPLLTMFWYLSWTEGSSLPILLQCCWTLSGHPDHQMAPFPPPLFEFSGNLTTDIEKEC